MNKTSCGILLFKIEDGTIFVLLAHPGGPLWEKKDFWTIPKGEQEAGESEIDTSRREFEEETGLKVPEGKLEDLGCIRQSSDKINHIWAIQGKPSLSDFASNSFSLEWPIKSGKLQLFPENDRIAWFDLVEARKKLFKTQKGFIDKLESFLTPDLIK